MSDEGTEESEYVRGSECSRIVIKTGQCINNMRNEIIMEKKRSKALEVVTKELSDKYKTERTKAMMLEQELDYYKKKTKKVKNPYWFGLAPFLAHLASPPH